MNYIHMDIDIEKTINLTNFLNKTINAKYLNRDVLRI